MRLLSVLLVGAAFASGGCVTRSAFERDTHRLRCALHRACAARTCARLARSADAADRELHALMCPPRNTACDEPDDPPSARCFTFDREQARRCVADLGRQLRASGSAPLDRDIFCWSRPASCERVYGEIPWPRCPLVR